MAIAEKFSESEKSGWERRLGIQVPVSGVIIQEDRAAHESVGMSHVNNFPDPLVATWATSQITLPPGYQEEFEGFAVIDESGFRSNMGFAIPREMRFENLEVDVWIKEYGDPFFFFWNFEHISPEIKNIDRLAIKEGWREFVDGKEEIEGYEVVITSEMINSGSSRGMNLWRIGHGYVNPLVLREVYKAGVIDGLKTEENFKQYVSKKQLISGIKGRRGRVGFRPSIPLEQLIGRFEPLIQRKDRFKGFKGQPAWVY